MRGIGGRQIARGQQRAGAQQVQVGVFGRQRQRGVDAVQRQRQRRLPLLLQRKRQPAVGGGVVGRVGDPLAGQRHRIVGRIAAQGLKNGVLHGGGGSRTNRYCNDARCGGLHVQRTLPSGAAPACKVGVIGGANSYRSFATARG
ncbi:hypothetical protein XMIN_3233 [Xanthomonas citri pv. mangiferaeindicae LMG 941]|nr:hypothetical protein XMIN_3233 [Xanthomonas citri pv. mangiferaeindicae LMG 941]